MSSTAHRLAGLPATCSPSQGTPVHTFTGDSDPINPADGGRAASRQYRAPAAATRWATINGYAGSSTVTETNGYVETSWQECARVPVISYLMAGMGHTWPGRGLDTQAEFADTLGPTSDALDANETMRTFFEDIVEK